MNAAVEGSLKAMNAETHAPRPAPRRARHRALCAGRVEGRRRRQVHKLSSNETPLGPSPAALAAYRDAARQLELYPDGRRGAPRRDRRAMASTRTASSAAPARTRSSPCSPTPISALATRRSTPSTASSSIRSPSAPPAPRRWWRRRRTSRTDVDAILARVTAKTRIVFIANPNNPTGTYIPFDEVRRLHAGLPPRRAARARRGLCRICPAQRL